MKRLVRPWQLIAMVLLVLLATLQARLWVGEGGMRSLHQLHVDIEAQQAENTRLKMRNDALRADITGLKDDGDAVNARARTYFGFTRPDEVFYQVIDRQRLESAYPPPSGESR